MPTWVRGLWNFLVICPDVFFYFVCVCEYFYFFIFIFWLCYMAGRILVPQQGMEPVPLQWMLGAITTGPEDSPCPDVSLCKIMYTSSRKEDM